MKNLGHNVKFLFTEILCIQIFYCLILFLQFHIEASPRATITFYRYIYFYFVSASYQLAFLDHRLVLRSESNALVRWKIVKDKVKCTFVQALRLCTGRTDHRGSRGIALLFYDQRH